MAGEVSRNLNSFTFSPGAWKTNMVSAGFFLVLILMISGYFYGCVLQKYVRSLRKADCTMLGVFGIMAVFQIVIYWSVSVNASTDIAYNLLQILIIGGPVLCLVTRSNPLPSWRHLVSLGLGIAISWIVCNASSQMTTNNIYFDSISYLSETIESSTAEHFAHLIYAGGVPISWIDPLHDYTGYYYFWGILLRWVSASGFFDLSGSLTPVYIWGSTMLYGMALGSLTANSVNLVYPKTKWKGLILAVLILAPYYTNYWNTTLAFFGNTMRTIGCGYAMLAAYLVLQKKDRFGLIPLLISYGALLCFSSSGLFLGVFIAAAMFAELCFAKEQDWKTWALYILSLTPLLHYGILVILETKIGYLATELLTIGIIAGLILIAKLLDGHYKQFDTGGKILLSAALAGLIVLSFLNRNGDYGYSFFFSQSSLSDMTLDMTSHTDTSGLIRNLIFYGLILLSFFNFRKGKKYKTFLTAILILFLNPLVQPAVSTYLTAQVYSRSFDLFTNPFTMVFLINSSDLLLQALSWVLLPLAGALSIMPAYSNLTVIENNLLDASRVENYQWEEKADSDSWELYSYVQENLADAENRPDILSQEIGLKGYVTDISLSFTATDYRSALADPDQNQIVKYIVSLMYPLNRFGNEENDLGSADFTKLSEILNEYKPDYLIISNTMAVWDERGWYNSAYTSIVNSGQAEKIWENDSWAVLKISKDWTEPNKNSERYWVHRISIPGESS